MEFLCYMEIHNICDGTTYDICHKPPCLQTLLEGYTGIKALLQICPCKFFPYCRDTFGKGLFYLTERILVCVRPNIFIYF